MNRPPDRPGRACRAAAGRKGGSKALQGLGFAEQKPLRPLCPASSGATVGRRSRGAERPEAGIGAPAQRALIAIAVAWGASGAACVLLAVLGRPLPRAFLAVAVPLKGPPDARRLDVLKEPCLQVEDEP